MNPTLRRIVALVLIGALALPLAPASEVRAASADGAVLLTPLDFFKLRARFNADMEAATGRAGMTGFDAERCEADLQDSSALDAISGLPSDSADLLDTRADPDTASKIVQDLPSSPEPISLLRYQAALSLLADRIPRDFVRLDADVRREVASGLEGLSGGATLPSEQAAARELARVIRDLADVSTSGDETALTEAIVREIERESRLAEVVTGMVTEKLRREREAAIMVSQVCVLQKRFSELQKMLLAVRQLLCKVLAITGPRKIMRTEGGGSTSKPKVTEEATTEATKESDASSSSGEDEKPGDTSSATVPEKAGSTEEALKALGGGFTVKSSGGCTDRSQANCTSLEGLQGTTIEGLRALRESYGRDLTITAGTEVGHAGGTTSHASGVKVDLAADASFGQYIQTVGTSVGTVTLPKSGGGTYQAERYVLNQDGYKYTVLVEGASRGGAHYDVKVEKAISTSTFQG